MIESLLMNELQTRAGFPVYPKVPATIPAQFYVLSKTGSSYEDKIKTATIAVQSYGRNQYEAATLNEIAKEAMLGLVDMEEISAVTLNSDYIYTDTSEKKDRYQAVFIITHY